jgi:hypothetical protein
MKSLTEEIRDLIRSLILLLAICFVALLACRFISVISTNAADSRILGKLGSAGRDVILSYLLTFGVIILLRLNSAELHRRMKRR